MIPQRKIPHLLANNGLTGRGFGYLPELNPDLKLSFRKGMTLTDKMDGTTCQANNEVVAQRRDRFKKGDPRKFTATEEERYRLEVLDFEEPQYKHIFASVEPYLKKFFMMMPGDSVYFECVGPKINARYRDSKPDIRVFDTRTLDTWQPFGYTSVYCRSYKLPLVGHHSHVMNNLRHLLEMLKVSKYTGLDYRKYELEGWVIRQGDTICKIRMDDLTRIEGE